MTIWNGHRSWYASMTARDQPQALSSGRPDTESRTANRVNNWKGLFAIDLSSQTSDVDIDNIRRRIEMQTPDVLQQQTSRDDFTGVAGEILQQSEFPGPQPDLSAGSGRGSSHEVDLQIPDAQCGFLPD